MLLLLFPRGGRTAADQQDQGWRGLGLHRPGARLWPVAFGLSLLISVVASAIVWASPVATFAAPDGFSGPLASFVVSVAFLAVTFVRAEEMAWRGYLLSHLLRSAAITPWCSAAWCGRPGTCR